MFFSDENNFEKYSIFANPDNKLKLNEFKQSQSKLEFLGFLKNCGYDLDWYEPLLETLSDKTQKLINPNTRQDNRHRRPYQNRYQLKRPQVQYDSEDLSESVRPKSPIQDQKIIEEFEYNPISPAQEEPIISESKIEEKVEDIKPIDTPKPISQPTKPIVERSLSRPETRQVRKGPELETPPDGKKPHERRLFNLMKNWYPLKFKLPYPRKSLLNAYEQKEFVEFHTKFRNRVKVTQSEVKLYKKYLHYKSQIDKERGDFFNYLREYYKLASEDYEYMNHGIEQYVKEMLAYFDSSVNKFERFYTKLNDLSLSQLDVNSNYRTVFQFERNLVQLGHLQKVIVPSITNEIQPNLIIDYTRLSKRAPVSKKGKTLSKIPLSQDKNAEKLVLKYNCGIAMTNSAFVNLVYNLTFLNSDEFKIPFVIKELEDQDGKKHKVLFIEKPFVDKHLSKREINEKFYKRALMTTLVKQQATRHKMTRQNPPQESPIKVIPIEEPKQETTRILEKLNVDYGLINNLDSFGVTLPEPTPEVEKPIEKLVEKILEKPEESKTENVKKRNRQSNESENSFLDTKKMKSNNSSDYEDYGEDEEDKDSESDGLVIAENSGETCKNETNETKIEVNPQIKEKHDETIQEPDEPDEAPESPSNNMESFPDDFVPKVIPLEKPAQPIEPSRPKQESKIIEESKKSKDTDDKLSLFDLISKLQDKLIEQPVKTQNSQPQSTHPHPSKASQYPAENPRDFEYLDNVHDNLNYTLWTLNSNPPLRILVRSSTDGYVNTEHSSMNSVVLYPKLEYQPQFGCEKLSTKDYSKMWAKSFIRNLSDIFLCRINPFTNKLISVTKLTYDELLPKDLEFNTNQTLNHMRNLFESLIKFENGSYLMNKEPNWSKFDILRSIQGHKPGALDLHFYYNGFIGENVKKPSYWMPVDPEIFMPYHYTLNRVPCLFEPQFKDFRKEPNRSPQVANKGNKKKRKPRNKKPNQNDQVKTST